MRYLISIIFIISLSLSIFKFLPVQDWAESTFPFLAKNPGVHLNTPQFTTSERIERGDAYLKQNFVELARDEYLLAIQKNPNLAIAYYKLAQTQSLLKNYIGAIDNLHKAIKLENSLAMQTALIETYIHQKDFALAGQIANQLQSQSPIIAYYALALKLSKEKFIDPQTSVPQAELEPKSQKLAQAFRNFKKFKDGQNIFLRALIAKAFIENQDYELAQFMLMNILSERSDYRDALIMLGYTYIQLNNYLLAQDHLLRAYDLDTSKPETQFLLGIAYDELKDKSRALEFYQLSLKNGYVPRIHVLQKVIDLSVHFGYYQEAYVLYQELLKESAPSPDLFIQPIWIALSKLQDLEKAYEMADWAEKLFPQAAQTYNLKGWISIEKNELKEAQAYIRQALVLDPQLAAAHYNQGRIFERKHEKAKSLKSYEKAYQLDKDGGIGNAAMQSYNRLIQQSHD